jgi:hypothetical protein
MPELFSFQEIKYNQQKSKDIEFNTTPYSFPDLPYNKKITFYSPLL